MDEYRGHPRGNYPDDRDHGYGRGYDRTARDYRHPGDYGYSQSPSSKGSSGMRSPSGGSSQSGSSEPGS